MARYIDAIKLSRDLAASALKLNLGKTTERVVNIICKIVMDEPEADVVEVKHSEWKLYDDGSGVCKNCNTHQRDVWDMDNVQRFCCRCGAKMDGGKAE